MSTLPGFWHGAATLSGRIDLSNAVMNGRGSIHEMRPDALAAIGVSPAHVRTLCKTPALTTGYGAFTLDNTVYPELLAPLPFAPPVLFVEGNTDLLKHNAKVAIVGARHCTDTGRRMAAELARGIAAAGGIIVSGLANGIDTAAHLAALNRTIAVLGCGLNRLAGGPKGRTAARILDSGGLLLSEFVPDYPASKYTFPQRNRIIAGLSSGTIVVEAGHRSGARITARHALEFGREVFAVPGSPYAPASSGCLALIAQGATMVCNVNDVFDRIELSPSTTSQNTHPILQAIKDRDVQFDELVDISGLPPSVLMRTLSMLELTGQVVRLAGDRYTEKR